MKALVAEDDENIRNGLLDILEQEGYEAIGAADGKEALAILEKESVDFVCLDIMMPKMDGYEVCRQIRFTNSDLPIIFITAKSQEVDKVLGLDLGADDFIMKPFGVREVVARIRAVTRRAMRKTAALGKSADFMFGEWKISPSELRAFREGETVELSLREVKIISLFHENSGAAIDRQTLFSEIWGWTHLPNSRSLDQQISKLRKKLEADQDNPILIQTVHGVGYRYDSPDRPKGLE